MSPRRRAPTRLSLRREALAVLPTATVLLALLALLAARAQRSTIDLWALETRQGAARLAEALARGAANGRPIEELQQQLRDSGGGVALLDPSGRITATAGEMPAALPPIAPVAEGRDEVRTEGPNAVIPGGVLATVAIPSGYLAVYLPAETLAGQHRAARLLFPWIAVVCAGVVLVVVLFVLRLLRPFDEMLARARESAAGEPAASEDDEVAFLLRSFERALSGGRTEPAAAPSRESALLAETLRRLGEVAAGVAHELRNGLATIKGYVSLLGPRLESTAAADDLAEIRHELDQLQRVVDDFLSFARPGSARPRLVDVHQLLRQAAADPSLQTAGVAVRVEEPDGPTPGAPVLLTVDPQLVERALRNLLRNAAQAQRDSGREDAVVARVEARTATNGGERREVAILIEDRGPGFPAALRQRLGEPFASARPGGSGLGLALVRRVAALHGGRMELEDRPGGGARAALVLPMEPALGVKSVT